MILDRILEHKKSELRRKKSRGYLVGLKGKIADRSAPSGFIKALEEACTPDCPALITEVKKASPSQGLMRPEFKDRFDPVEIAGTYKEHGAAAVSVLTDQEFFQGHLDHLARVKDHVGLPALNKEFMIEDVQFYEARAYGADAVLLIVRPWIGFSSKTSIRWPRAWHSTCWLKRTTNRKSIWSWNEFPTRP